MSDQNITSLERMPETPSAVVKPMTPARTTPTSWRLAIVAWLAAFIAVAYLLGDSYPHFRACCGIFVFFGTVALFSSNLRAVNWGTIRWGIALQAVLAVLVLRVPAVERIFEAAGQVVRMF